jgi:hypothetical protein
MRAYPVAGHMIPKEGPPLLHGRAERGRISTGCNVGGSRWPTSDGMGSGRDEQGALAGANLTVIGAPWRLT